MKDDNPNPVPNRVIVDEPVLAPFGLPTTLNEVSKEPDAEMVENRSPTDREIRLVPRGP